MTITVLHNGLYISMTIKDNHLLCSKDDPYIIIQNIQVMHIHSVQMIVALITMHANMGKQARFCLLGAQRLPMCPCTVMPLLNQLHILMFLP